MNIKAYENIIEIEYDDGSSYKFDWLRLNKYWEYANLEDNEGIRASFDGKYLTVILLVAQGQGGVAAIIDVKKDEIIHIHEADYAVKVLPCGNKVVTLREVCNFAVKPHFYIDVIDMGNMEYSSPEKGMKLDEYKNLDIDNLELTVNIGTGNVKIDDGKEKIELNISNLL